MIHKEGYPTLILSAIILGGINYYIFRCCGPQIGFILSAIFVPLYLFLISFFRNPVREIPNPDSSLIYAPADGKVVVIERAIEKEFFKEERMQISIFMSPLNVHVNRSSTDAKVIYKKYHSGKYLAAWNPKSSDENERCTFVVDQDGKQILFKQIAGALARRIVNYVGEGDDLKQGQEIGFIKFGSRMDIFLPLDSKVKVEMGQAVKGNLSVIAEL